MYKAMMTPARQVLMVSFLLILSAPMLQGIPQSHCHPEVTTTLCTTNLVGCYRIPTTLAVVDELLSADDGWTLGTRCGVDLDGLPCGKYFGHDVCPDESTCECGPGHPPCSVTPEPGAAVVAEQQAYLEKPPPPAAVFGKSQRLSPAASATETAEIREKLARLAAGLSPPLAAIWQRFSALEAVNLKAAVEVQKAGRTPSGAQSNTGLGSYEYWEQGDLYKVSVTLPDALEMSRVTDVAFDGFLRQMFFADTRMVTESREDSRQVPVAVRNPLFLPLSFLNPALGDTCGLCELRLADLRAAEQAQHTAPPTSAGGPGPGEARDYQVLMSENGEDIAAIEARGASGQVLSRALFSDYQEVPGELSWRFPMTIRLESISETSEDQPPRLVVVYHIEHLTSNRPVEPGTFRIPLGKAERVWEDEDRSFVKRPHEPPRHPEDQ